MSVISFEEQRKRLESISKSKSQSTLNTQSDEHGQTLTDEQLDGIMDICEVILTSRVKPFTTKSDFARSYATVVALCAVEGLITTKINDTTFGNIWMVTGRGMEYLEEVEDVLGIS